MGRLGDLSGQQFERLKVLHEVERYIAPGGSGTRRQFLCRCTCGTQVVATASRLRSGETKSCGCLQREVAATQASQLRQTHAMSKTRVYRIWLGMVDRCTRSSQAKYADYGGRGIRVCERWRRFEAFYEDMGEPPSDQYSIERRDVNGHYEKSNCYWATQREQCNNTRTNVRLDHNGVTQTLTQWAEQLGLNAKTLWTRIFTLGWTVEKALTSPTRQLSKEA